MSVVDEYKNEVISMLTNVIGLVEEGKNKISSMKGWTDAKQTKVTEEIVKIQKGFEKSLMLVHEGNFLEASSVVSKVFDDDFNDSTLRNVLLEDKIPEFNSYRENIVDSLTAIFNIDTCFDDVNKAAIKTAIKTWEIKCKVLVDEDTFPTLYPIRMKIFLRSEHEGKNINCLLHHIEWVDRRSDSVEIALEIERETQMLILDWLPSKYPSFKIKESEGYRTEFTGTYEDGMTLSQAIISLMQSKSSYFKDSLYESRSRR